GRAPCDCPRAAARGTRGAASTYLVRTSVRQRVQSRYLTVPRVTLCAAMLYNSSACQLADRWNAKLAVSRGAEVASLRGSGCRTITMSARRHGARLLPQP